MEIIGGLLSGLLLIVAVFFAYFLPSFVGAKKKNANAIFILNLLLGWTFIGWIIALVWACTVDANIPIMAGQKSAIVSNGAIVCLRCRERNNPSFSECWKCGQSLLI